MLASLVKLKLYSKAIPIEFQTFKRGVFMKILVLTSGGDAPGMNQTIYQLKKSFKDDLYASLKGFKGLINGNIVKVPDCRKEKNKAGSIIFSSRCPEFATREGFSKALENAKKFDYIIVLGGNGSFHGAKELSENGINAIFVPATIDNDVENSSYSIGFDSAVSQGVYTIENSMPSINAFCQTCLFEVMGRKCDAIAKAVSKQVLADYTICEEKDLKFKLIEKIIKERRKNFLGTSVVVRENIMPINEMAEKLNKNFKEEVVKTQVVGRLQRGGKPTSKELSFVDKFSDAVISLIKSKKFNKQVLMDEKNSIKILDF